MTKTKFTPVQFNHAKATDFYNDLKARVKEYFVQHDMSEKGDWRLYLKTSVLLWLWVAVFLTIVLVARSWLAIVPLYVARGLLGALIGFNIMHDGSHGGYSDKKRVNTLMGHAMNLLGSDVSLWKVQHNVLHHTYTNIDGYDNDINAIPVFRFHPDQPLKRYHRYQHVYAIPAYGVGTLIWIFLSDFQRYFTRKIGAFSFKPFTLSQHTVFWITKCAMVSMYIVLPIVVLGWVKALIWLLIMFFCMSVFLDIVFQMAHVMEETTMVSPDENHRVDQHRIVHELDTTANFAMGNRFWTWLLGGLNYQVEHHLFPHISHIHYPALAPIVQKLCQEYGIPYHSYATVSTAFVSHLKYLKRMGR